jgi:hypothetical protein
MTRSKLSASDREELIRLFKETPETITSLANQFQVCVSTARRVLKTQLSAEEYETIVTNRLVTNRLVTNRLDGRQYQKNGVTSASGVTHPEPLDRIETSTDEVSSVVTTTDKPKIAPPVPRPQRRSRRRSSAEVEVKPFQAQGVIDQQSDLIEALDDIDEQPNHVDPTVVDPTVIEAIAASPLPPLLRKHRVAEASTASSESESFRSALPNSADLGSPLKILPIETAALPDQCYMVVDRASELITPPLREFSELGNIPSSEESAKTLPIFENHKIASRFSRRSQRIIKIPNSAILKKTYALLNAKGVERLLFDGQVFSLSNNQH